MATKKLPVAKKTTAKSSKPEKKSAKKRHISPKMLYAEKNPEKHQMTGKYKFFYVLFACTTLFFAALSVWLFVFSCDIMNKYESIDSCVRAHTSCKVTYEDGNINVEE